MEEDRLCRMRKLIGNDATERLKACSVAVFGIGGVGGYAAEAVARSGIGKISLFDGDKVAASNLNRQIVALESTIGHNKAEVMKERIAQINPLAEVTVHKLFYTPQNSADFRLSGYDFIIDAVDMVTAKIELAVMAKEAHVRLISCMGTGNKLHPEMLRAADIYDTSVCPLARVMRRELKKRGIDSLRVVYSTEEPIEPQGEDKRTPASAVFVPAAAGMLLAAEAVRELLNY